MRHVCGTNLPSVLRCRNEQNETGNVRDRNGTQMQRNYTFFQELIVVLILISSALRNNPECRGNNRIVRVNTTIARAAADKRADLRVKIKRLG